MRSEISGFEESFYVAETAEASNPTLINENFKLSIQKVVKAPNELQGGIKDFKF